LRRACWAWAFNDPRLSLQTVVYCALVVAFASATQDIALDAYRIESADMQRQAALAAAYQTGYRMAMIWAGAGVLWIAARAEVPGAVAYQHGAWQAAYIAMALSMSVGIVTVLLSPEPARRELPPAKKRRRLAAQRAGRALCRIHPPLPLAGRPHPGADRGLPDQRRGDGHHGQPVLRGHGLHQG
jgi:MFS family permease